VYIILYIIIYLQLIIIYYHIVILVLLQCWGIAVSKTSWFCAYVFYYRW